MLSKELHNKLVTTKMYYYLKNANGEYYQVDPLNYKKLEADVYIFKNIDLFLPDFDYLYKEMSKVFVEMNLMYNPLEEALNSTNIEDNPKLEEYYSKIKIGLYKGLNYHLSVGSKNSDIVINKKRIKPDKFIRTIKVYKEMLENYCSRHNNDKTVEYKKYIEQIETGEIPLIIRLNNKEVHTDIVNYLKIVGKYFYREIGDYTSNKVYSGFYTSHAVRYYDELGNRYEIKASNATHAEQILTYIASAIDKAVEEKGYTKKLIKK